MIIGKQALARMAVAIGVTAASCFAPPFGVVPRPVSGDGGSGGSGGELAAGGAGGAGGCVHKVWPGLPTMDDPSSANLEFIVAVRSVDMGDGAPDLDSVGPKIGYDLDLHCTGDGDPSSCLAPPGVAAASYKDGPGGVDNVAAKLFASAKAFSTKIGSVRYTESAEMGGWSLLLRVQEYNGTSNDTHVKLSLFPSPGIHTQSCVADATVPAWDGSDAWPIESSSLELGSGFGSDGGTGPCGKGVPGFSFDGAKFYDANAYVSNGTLVANIPNSQIIFASSSSSTILKLTAGFVTGKIVKDGTSFRLTNGVLAGRWKAVDLFSSLTHVLENGKSICTDSAVYQAVKLGVCQARDIAATLGGPTTPCDALSLALSFETFPAKLGIVLTSALSVSTCPQATDPNLDSCSN